jgi:hypothetical protein
LQIQYPGTEIGQATILQKISQQMNRMALQFGGKLDAAHQLHSRTCRNGHGLIVALEGIVVGDSKRIHAAADGFFNELRGRKSAVRFVSVRVQIDQRRPNLDQMRPNLIVPV